MLNRKKIKQYLQKQCEGLINCLAGNLDEDKLHDARLHLKKIRAIAVFLRDCTQNEKSFSVKRLKELFHTAGEIRTAQLNLKTLKRHNIKNDSFVNEQEKIIDTNVTRLKDQSSNYIKNIKNVKKLISQNVTDISNDKVIGYYYTNIKLLSNNFTIIDENNLHDSRKIIKRLLYVLKVLPESLLTRLNINANYLDDLQEFVGKWHDTVVTLEVLSQAGIVSGEGVSGLIRQKQHQLQTIIEQTRSFDASVMFAITA